MKDIKKITFLVSTALLSGTAMAGVDSRSVAMGDTGAASSDYMSSVFSNPALSAKRDSDPHFGAILPFISGSFKDKDKLIDKVNDFQSLNSDLGTSYSSIGGKGISKENAKKWIDDVNGIAKAKEGIEIGRAHV